MIDTYITYIKTLKVLDFTLKLLEIHNKKLTFFCE